MQELVTKDLGLKPKRHNLKNLGLRSFKTSHWNLPTAKLIEIAVQKNEGKLANSGALVIDTGIFKGRSPKDKFVVKDEKTKDTVWWGEVNIPFNSKDFQHLFNCMKAYLSGRSVYINNMAVCADKDYRLNVTVVTNHVTSALFANNMFIRLRKEEIENYNPEWTVVCAPHFYANPETDKTRGKNFTIINFTEKVVLIGGTGYTGEIKKGIFSVLNYILPVEQKILPMHCSANVDKKHNTAIFFGLSGTGKTTLSADPSRSLIGDDEHAWSDKSIFNFEGGCYAKCVNLSKEKEPDIFNAIKFGALLENVNFYPDNNTVDYSDISKTENTRVSYPLDHVDNVVTPSIGGIPKDVIFLTCDAYGILPPISKLSIGQAMYHYISGYTAKVAGTEVGITEPIAVFSACYGQPFLPLRPSTYATLLGEKIKQHKTNIWLLNTGWIGGSYGVGKRISLRYTRALLHATMNDQLNDAPYEKLPVFKLQFPTKCPDVPSNILNPMQSWADKNEYLNVAKELAKKFDGNFKKFVSLCDDEVIEASHLDF